MTLKGVLERKHLQNFVVGLRDVNNPFVDSTYLSTMATSTRSARPPMLDRFQIKHANDLEARSSKRGFIHDSLAILSVAGGCRSLAKRIGSPCFDLDLDAYCFDGVSSKTPDSKYRL